ncbi:AAA family ATPase [Acidisphaera sp. S103]|uniref:AAA family ATPase n=1 Tax=Acidisphaera sp. S103 TaxID=1747223 RepID=UPI00131DAE2E|nr:AAA family ATPase [Acidisphaera sp. S103]
MKVVAVESSKGGTGKSTLSIHLAVAAEAVGLVVALFDLDPQASAAVWSDHRGEAFPAVVPAQAPRLRGLLRQAQDKGVDIVILDTPPHADGVSAEAGAVADLVLIPCRPSSLDLGAVGATIRVARTAGTPTWVVINAAPAQGVEVAETKAALADSGVYFAPVVIHQRKAFSSRLHEGRTAGEHEPRGKAAAEIESLLAWLLAVIGLPVDQASAVESNPATVVTGHLDSTVAHP